MNDGALETTRDSSGLILGVVAMVLLVVGGGWLVLTVLPSSEPVFTDGQAPAGARNGSSVQITDPLPEDRLSRALELGELALAAGQIDQPPASSALAFFLTARSLSPGDERVADGVNRVAALLRERAEAAIASGDSVVLSSTLESLNRIGADDPALLAVREAIDADLTARLGQFKEQVDADRFDDAQATLVSITTGQASLDERVLAASAQLDAARAAAAQSARAARRRASPAAPQPAAASTEDAAPPAPTAAERQQTELVERIAAGNLIAPAGSSAVDALRQWRAAAPDDPAVNAAQTRLLASLAARAQALAADDQFATAARYLDAADALSSGAPVVARAREALLDRQRRLEARRVIPVGEMTNTRVVRPRYPTRALRAEAEGSVLVNFTVQADGTTADVEAVQVSERYSTQFERSAIAAVSQWEFEPRQFLGQTIEQRVEARVTFELTP
ncbi:MAG: energy transducer TonB [Pseudomonadota bacterium]